MIKTIIRNSKEYFMENTSFLEISFGGTNDIQLDTLSLSLEETLNCLKKIADCNNTPDKYIRFVVDSVKPGSFIITIKEILTDHERLITMTSSIITIFQAIMGLRKHLRGKFPVNVEYEKTRRVYNIFNFKNEKYTVTKNIYNIYTGDNDIEKSLANLNKALDLDAQRTDLTITTYSDKKQMLQSVTFDSEEVKLTSNPLDVESLSKELKEVYSDLWLKVKRLYFIGDAQWEFIATMNKTSITASIEDKDWLKKVRDGQLMLGAGTKIFAKVRTRYNEDKDGNIVGKPKNAIVAVKEVVNPTTEQTKIDLSDYE